MNSRAPLTPIQEHKMVIEHNKRLADSCLWQMQRDYFDKAGINAWVDQVPFYVTSNPFIANTYATLAVYFVRDWIAQHPESKKHPFYIMELGTGPGQFSFYAMKKIRELRQELAMHDVKIIYVMSDFTRSNIEHWDTHPALKSYVEEGVLDFAIYNLEDNATIVLEKQQITLTPDKFVNPLIAFANYIFDTVSHDAFTVQEGKLKELLVNLATAPENLHEDKPIDWQKVAVTYDACPIQMPYYPDENLNAVLGKYETLVNNTSFLFPVGAFQAIKNLRKLTGDKLFLVSSDKGYLSLKSMENLAHPSIAFHGSFSMMVNFHAIAEYFKQIGGDQFLQTPREGINSAIFCSGFKLKDMPETWRALQQHIEGFSPADYFMVHRRIRESHEECKLEALAAHMALSGWDPYIFKKISRRLCSLVENSVATSVQFLVNNMPKVLASFYYMPKGDNTPFEVGVFLHTAKRYELALECYRQAIPYSGKSFDLYYNMGICYYHAGQKQEALENFRASLQINPGSKEAADWLAFMEKPAE